jgi:hypothetical protein
VTEEPIVVRLVLANYEEVVLISVGYYSKVHLDDVSFWHELLDVSYESL